MTRSLRRILRPLVLLLMVDDDETWLPLVGLVTVKAEQKANKLVKTMRVRILAVVVLGFSIIRVMRDKAGAIISLLLARSLGSSRTHVPTLLALIIIYAVAWLLCFSPPWPR